MKEFLASFPTSTKSNTTAERTFTSAFAYRISKDFISLFVLGSVFLLASTNVSTAQSNDPAIATLALTPELVVSEWKSPLEYSAVLTSMKVSTANKLAEPNLPEPQRALYTGFDRMLSYIQADVEIHADLTKIPEINYNKVVNETPSDPILSNMPMSEFANLYEGLVNKLRQ